MGVRMETVVSYILVSFLNAGLPVVHGGRLTAGAARMVKLSSELQ
jgi:hypothetical protein